MAREQRCTVVREEGGRARGAWEGEGGQRRATEGDDGGRRRATEGEGVLPADRWWRGALCVVIVILSRRPRGAAFLVGEPHL